MAKQDNEATSGAMEYFRHGGREYKVDSKGFLMDPNDWDKNFAEGMAPGIGITDGLTSQHWKVISFLRNSFESMNTCPLVYVACRENDLGLGDIKRLFPAGYLRGACKLAGVTHREAYLKYVWQEHNFQHHLSRYRNSSYEIDDLGFLTNPDDWDENFALRQAYEMGMPNLLTDKHWRIIRFLRDRYRVTGEVPTIYETCEINSLKLEDLERLFPDGYHRGAVKIAGLKVR